MYKSNKRIKHKMIILAAFIVGILISIYIKTLDSSKVYITLEQKKEIQGEIDLTKKEIDKLKNILEEQKKISNEYESALKDEKKSIKAIMEDELIQFKVLSGYTPIRGSGLVITIMDSEKELEVGQNPNDLIVHDIDILRVLNDLKKSGAEAISINGERVLLSSKIKCSGATITVNETTYGQPFIIRAIGDIEILKAAMISPQSYAKLLEEGYGISIKVEEKKDMIINSNEKSK